MPALITRICKGIGILLLFGCFAGSVAFNLARAIRENDPDTKILHFAHFHLHGGLRESYELIAAEYTRRNPGIRVEQIDIPIGVFPAWVSTQLVGNHTPDLMLISGHFTDDRLARYVEPITAQLEQPNPYNAGTALEDVAWRDTFVGGLYGGSSFSQFQKMQDFLSVPTALMTIRLYYNQDLLEKITGRRTGPTTFDEYVELCEKVIAYSSKSGRKVVPMAGSKYNAIRLLQVLFTAQTQALAAELVDSRHEAVDSRMHVGLGFLNGSLSLNHPSIRNACQLSRDSCRFMQDGFMQVNREDATFLFAQERALMIVSGSWDISTFQKQCQFPIAVAEIPLPTRGHPVHGQFLFSKSVESAFGNENFGVMSRSKNKREALDFLQFLTSKTANQILADTSGWVPVIVGVDVPSLTKPFLPHVDGRLPGFHFTYNHVGAETTGVFYAYLHTLLSPGGSVDAFVDAAQEEMQVAMRKDLATYARRQRENLVRMDISIAAARTLLSQDEGSRVLNRRISITYRNQNQSESDLNWLNHQLARTL